MLRYKYYELKKHGILAKVDKIQELSCTKVGCKFQYQFIDQHGVRQKGKETIRLWKENLIFDLRSKNREFYVIFSSKNPSNNEMILLDDYVITVNEEMIYEKPPDEMYRTLKYYE